MPTDDTFVTHTLAGERFQDHAVPVEVLPELAAYRQLVLAVARALFFKRNAGRQRVPKGFEDGFKLVLRAIGSGSAVMALERVASEPPPSGPQLTLLDGLDGGSQPDEFEAARDLITQSINAIGHGSRLPQEFPESALPLFNGFGASLRADEHIIVNGPSGARATYDRTTRKRLVLLREKTYEDDIEIAGTVAQYDRHRMVFEILVDGRRVQGKLDGLPDEALAVIRTAVAVEPAENLRVRVFGRGAFDHADTLMRFVSVAEVSYAEDEALRQALDVKQRLASLAKLADGWLDGAGQTFDQAGLLWLTNLLAQAIEELGLPHPYLYPVPEGDVVAEWPFPSAEVSADFNLASQRASLVGTHLRTGAVAELELDFRKPDAIEQLVVFVTKFGPEGLTGKP